MSKSLGNYIGISEPPEQIYGKTMSIPDHLTEKYLRLVSAFESKQQADVLAMKPRDAKAALARQLVVRLHGEEAAARAEEDFELRFRRRELPVDVAELHPAPPQRRDIVNVLIDAHRAHSRGDARRLIEQGGVRVDGNKVGLDFEFTGDAVLQVGKAVPIRIQVR
jgi:tyrosyl-tRNA synthetase